MNKDELLKKLNEYFHKRFQFLSGINFHGLETISKDVLSIFEKHLLENENNDRK